MDRERNKIIIFIKLKYLIISMNIEVELRTFLTKEKYAELLEFFNRNGSFMSTEKQETHYLNTSEDLRIQKNDFFAKICLTPKIKWYRTRITFAWEGISVMIDDTKGYGYILELEKMSTEEKKEQDLSLLKKKLQQLQIPLSTKEEFEQKFKDYEQKWEILTK